MQKKIRNDMEKKGTIKNSCIALFLTKLLLLLAAIGVLIWVNPWFSFIILAIVLWMVIDVVVGIACNKACLRRPAFEEPWIKNRDVFSDLIWVVEHIGKTHPDISYNSDTLTEDQVIEIITPSIEWVKNKYDCVDFRASRLLRFAMGFEKIADKVSPSGKVMKMVDETLLGMKLWITEKGDESVCYYSENHQLAFFVLAYLLGRRYPDQIFTNSGITGREHEIKARERMLIWFGLRSKYGFSEFYSHNYLPVDFCELSMLILYGDKNDTELMNKAKATLDMLCLDYAHTLAFNTTIGPQGRAYARNNINCARDENNTDIIVDAIWNDMQTFGGENYHKGQHSVNFINLLLAKDEEGNPLYTVPKAIVDIGKCDKPVEIKTSSGIDLKTMVDNGLVGHSDKQMMCQLGMGALTNSEIIENTMDYVNRYRLLRNNFLTSFKYFNISFLRWLGVFPIFSRNLNLYTNGMALERANVYIYRTKDYKLSSLQGYKPGSFGAQQTTMAAILPQGVSIYTHQPQKETIFTTSPGFWGGYGVAPHCVQDKNVCMMIHHIPNKKPALSPCPMLPYTHTFFPEELLDECVVDGHYAFCRKDGTYLAIIGTGDFEYLPFDEAKTEIMEGLLQDHTKKFELVQRGRIQATIYELSTESKEKSFDAFMKRIKANEVCFYGDKLTYASSNNGYDFKYLGDFVVNGETKAQEYDRYDSTFIHAKYLDEDFKVQIDNESWHFSIANGVRER